MLEILTLNCYNGAEEYKNYGTIDWEYFVKIRDISRKNININPVLYNWNIYTKFTNCNFKLIYYETTDLTNFQIKNKQ